MRLLSTVKNLVIPPGRGPRNVLGGPFKGIKMNLSMQDETQVYLGLFERETHPWLMRLSRNLRSAVDIGAAHGEHTLFFLTKTEAARVYAFEPDTSCLPLFRENLSLNEMSQSPRLQICTKLVSDSDNENQISLDSLANTIDLPCLIKMDVDGAEERVLRGARAMNALSDIRWLIETHSKENELACLRILSGAGFQTRIIPNAWWRVIIPELRPSAHNRWLAAWRNV